MKVIPLILMVLTLLFATLQITLNNMHHDVVMIDKKCTFRIRFSRKNTWVRNWFVKTVSRLQDMSPLQTLSFPLVQKAETKFV